MLLCRGDISLQSFGDNVFFKFTFNAKIFTFKFTFEFQFYLAFTRHSNIWYLSIFECQVAIKLWWNMYCMESPWVKQKKRCSMLVWIKLTCPALYVKWIRINVRGIKPCTHASGGKSKRNALELTSSSHAARELNIFVIFIKTWHMPTKTSQLQWHPS